MASEIVLPKPKNTMAEEAVKFMDNILAAGSVDRSTFATQLVLAINDLTTKCTIASVLRACVHAVRVGFAPGCPHKLAYFVPRGGKVNYELGYRGYLELAYANGFLKDVTSEVVLRGEEFEVIGTENGKRLRHRFDVLARDTSNKAMRQNMVGAYCTWTTRRGGHGVVVLSREQIDRVDSESNVWASDYLSMVLKTPVRRAARWWQLTNRLALALSVEEHQDVHGEPPKVDAEWIEDESPQSSGAICVDDLEVGSIEIKQVEEQ